MTEPVALNPDEIAAMLDQGRLCRTRRQFMVANLWYKYGNDHYRYSKRATDRTQSVRERAIEQYMSTSIDIASDVTINEYVQEGHETRMTQFHIDAASEALSRSDSNFHAYPGLSREQRAKLHQNRSLLYSLCCELGEMLAQTSFVRWSWTIAEMRQRLSFDDMLRRSAAQASMLWISQTVLET